MWITVDNSDFYGKVLLFFRECKLEEPKPVAVDDETAERLWNISLLLCGLKQKQLQSESIWLYESIS